jgi:hypothetical protein
VGTDDNRYELSDTARVSDLGPDDFVQVECGCGHTELWTAAMLATAGVGPDQKVLDLKRNLNAGSADEKAGLSCRLGGLAVRAA